MGNKQLVGQHLIRLLARQLDVHCPIGRAVRRTFESALEPSPKVQTESRHLNWKQPSLRLTIIVISKKAPAASIRQVNQHVLL